MNERCEIIVESVPVLTNRHVSVVVDAHEQTYLSNTRQKLESSVEHRNGPASHAYLTLPHTYVNDGTEN